MPATTRAAEARAAEPTTDTTATTPAVPGTALLLKPVLISVALSHPVVIRPLRYHAPCRLGRVGILHRTGDLLTPHLYHTPLILHPLRDGVL